MTWTIHTDVFEGPLDLLLYLVRRDGIDLRELSVARIADAYLEFLDHLRVLNLSVAGEYLVMAATLIHLKSLELLPRLPVALEDEEEDPREELARQLRDYQRYKEAAKLLDARPLLGRDQFAREVDEDGEPGGYELETDAFGLLEIYRELLARAEEPEPEVRFEVEIGRSIGDAARALLEVLADRPSIDLGELLGSMKYKADRVVTFICSLEMIKLGWVGVEQRAHLGTITMTRRIDPAQADLGALTGWVEAVG